MSRSITRQRNPYLVLQMRLDEREMEAENYTSSPQQWTLRYSRMERRGRQADRQIGSSRLTAATSYLIGNLHLFVCENVLQLI